MLYSRAPIVQVATRLSLLSVAIAPVAHAANVPDDVTLAAQQQLVRGNYDEPPSVDPAYSSTGSSSSVVQDMFEGLVTQDAQGNPIPALATSWDVNQDGTRYVFHLRKDIHWSNGQPIVASDFVYAYQRLVAPKTAAPYAWYYAAAHVKNAQAIIDGKKPAAQLGVKALDDKTLAITLDQPLPYFISMLVHESFFPVPKAVVKQYGDKWTTPKHIVTSSAFTLTQHIVNERIVVKRNPYYWNNKKTVLNRVTYLALSDTNAEYNRFKTGEISITGHVPTESIDKIRKNAPKTLIISPKIAEYYYSFNTTKAPFNDAKVRKAFSYAINRQVIAQGILHLDYIPAYSFVPPATAGYRLPTLEWSQLTQAERIKKAQAWLKEAGYDKQHPLTVTFDYPTDNKVRKIAIAVASMLQKNLGVKVNLRNQDIKTFLQKVHQHDLSMASFQWGGDYNEASTFLDLFSTQGYNPGQWSNAKYDAFMEQAKHSLNAKTRLSLYHQAEQILAKEMPVMPIYFETKAVLKQTNVGGYTTENPSHIRYSRDMYITKP
ncbi:peptide ABC transporter substrate-binding protein [Vibrio palustris]|uniref:Periplasmic oligopeptide-binding protein n=1 Tax=Vibrio palustris TaxID=1918946 RepID=A0A1R4B5N4_9VIBR|nr:peptide ABC transporter substrate-binding protein [Vibrio palustris]SJL84234.1 Periplasmic oligopeptide-binding protein precursor [Vibrio palustris]